jgi:hypothetical protein
MDLAAGEQQLVRNLVDSLYLARLFIFATLFASRVIMGPLTLTLWPPVFTASGIENRILDHARDCFSIMCKT